ncbi:hypothetical protein [Rudanella lutea]|uniref:hypothetical protein n=1 Tax=Rudanella lutea TaxID=451374 RepID=UPI001B7FCD22|nr:hypothetical protein [Rudanella lutea]
MTFPLLKAYNPEHVRNRLVRQQAERWQREGLLKPEQLAAVRQAYPVSFRENNIFSEIGAFIFTGIAVGGAYALLMLFLSGLVDQANAFGVFNTVVGVGMLLLAHGLIGRYHFYRSGPDNALVVMGAAFLLAAFNVVLPGEIPFWLRCLLAVPLLLGFVWYYGDVILMFIAILAFYGAIFSGLLEFPWGRLALPFVLMAVSALVWFGLSRLKRVVPNPDYYADAFGIADWVSLGVLAASGNYFVVRELNGLLADPVPGVYGNAEAPPIRFGLLFWFLTFFFPGLYGWLGIRQKNRLLIILGILGIAAAVSTVRYYYPVGPLSVYLTIVGFGMIAVAVWLIRYLRQPRRGFTDVPDEESPRQFFLNAETLSLISTTGATLDRQPDLRYGGGDFGGGGAGKNY